MRRLKDAFLKDCLPGGLLHPVVDLVRGDHTLDFQIRNNYVNIYYRGGNILKISTARGCYRGGFSSGYDKQGRFDLKPLPSIPDQAPDAGTWVDAISRTKSAMNSYFAMERDKTEGEFQQLICRDNNVGKTGNVSDFCLCDVEYHIQKKLLERAGGNGAKGMRFDMIALRRPRPGDARKGESRLAIVEVKYGDGALTGSASLAQHVEDVDEFLGLDGLVSELKESMLLVHDQKRRLKLIADDEPIERISDEKPLLILVIANHDPRDRTLRRVLETLSRPVRAELRIATSSFMGYGLFERSLLDIDTFLETQGHLL